MEYRGLQRPRKKGRNLAVAAPFANSTGGWATDSGQLITDLDRAGLDSIINSSVDAVSDELAGD